MSDYSNSGRNRDSNVPSAVQSESSARTTVTITGTGSCIPEKILTNDDLTKLVETTDEWIVSRTGIRERRIAAPNETASDMAVRAGVRALESAGLGPGDIDLVIVATITPDMLFPSTACLVQDRLGMRNVCAFDVEAACSGFIYITEIASAMLQSGRFRHALIIGTEKLSSILDWSDRSTCVLFGDGAGAAVLSREDNPGEGRVEVVDTLLGSDGSASNILYMPGGGCRIPASADSVAAGYHFLKMNGREVFKVAVRIMERAALEILQRNNVPLEKVRCIIPHQANVRIIEMLSERMKLPMDRFHVNLDLLGNTSAASVPLALDEAMAEGKISDGDYVVLVAFGAGLTWGATLLRRHEKSL